LEEVFVRLKVRVVVQVCGKLRGRVHQAEGHVAFFERAPLARGGGVDDCFA
jgi:hypothetical protein